MKPFLTLFFILLPFFFVKSQIVSLQNGFIQTRTKYRSNDVCINNSYAAFVSIDYFEKKNYYVSSQVGYFQTGYFSYSYNYLGHLVDNPKFKTNDIHINTTLRYKIPVYQFFMYAGLGPKMDITINPSSKKEGYIYPYTDHFRNTFGAKFDFGFCYDINRFRIGLNASYLTNFGNGRFNSNKFVAGISVGYRYKK
ncbi:MAG: hypothetical protein LBE79_01615 [Tannerella sp.]|jgi:hypothetical protein|nr:hypothetical protein [Tannerella sp.]